MKNLSPYQQAASGYLMAGWVPFVLPEKMKSPPPYGFTGADGVDADEEQYAEWSDHNGNVALRMAETMIGIDIDRDKETGELIGWQTYQELAKTLGPLPIEFVISNQEDAEHGFTAFFTVPAGIKWRDSAGLKIDIVQRSHRYQVAAPSIHPDGPVYSWRSFNGWHRVPFIPDADSMPALPAAWVNYLTKPVAASVSPSKPKEEQLAAPVSISLAGPSCALMRSIAGTRIQKLKALNGSRHDFMVATTFAIVSEAFKGHTGGEQALHSFAEAWANSFADKEKEGRDLQHEFNSAVESAKRKMHGKQGTGCGCGKKRAPVKRGTPPRTSASLKMFR